MRNGRVRMVDMWDKDMWAWRDRRDISDRKDRKDMRGGSVRKNRCDTITAE